MAQFHKILIPKESIVFLNHKYSTNGRANLEQALFSKTVTVISEVYKINIRGETL